MTGWVCEVDLRRDSAGPVDSEERTVLTAYRSTELAALLGVIHLVLASRQQQIAADFDEAVKLARALGLDKLMLTETASGSEDGTLVVRGPDDSELYRIPAKQQPSDQPVAWATEAQLRHGMTRLLEALKDRGDRDPKRGVVDQVLALLTLGDKAMVERDHVLELHDHLSRQIGQLATYIMDEIPGEPSQNESAVECAIRLLRRWRQDSVTLNCIANSAARALGETDGDKPVEANPAELVQRLVDRVNKLVQALRLSVEYVGTATLKPYAGWSWYDALTEVAPSLAEAFKERHERLTDKLPDGGKPCDGGPQ